MTRPNRTTPAALGAREPAMKVNAMQPAKKGRPAHNMKLGVAEATPRHPTRSNNTGEANMREPAGNGEWEVRRV
jgi:hypothetical protein